MVINGSYINALVNKGSALDDLGKYEEAITWYDKALAVDPIIISDIVKMYNVFICVKA